MALNKREQNVGAIISLLAVTLLLTYFGFGMLGLNSEIVALAAMGGSLVASTCLCLFVLRRYRKEGNPEMIDYLNVSTQRYVLAILMIMYGIDKLLGNFFDYQLFALDSKLSDVSEFQLAWFFYGKNRWQELFTGIMEFVPGLFLLRRRTYYVAALVMLPVSAQVFLLNLFFKIGGITFPVSCVLLACDIYIIYSQKEKIVAFFKSLNFTKPEAPSARASYSIRTARRIGIFLVCFVLFIKLRPTIFRSPYQKKYASLVGAYTFREMKKNNIAYTPAKEGLYYKDLYIEKQDRWNILRKFDNDVEAFILRLNTNNDSVSLYLNKGGTGDDPRIVDSGSVFKGVYQLNGKYFTVRGIQQKDTLDIVYEKQEGLRPKSWFW